MKKLSLLLALVFVFCITIPVFAESPTDTGKYKVVKSNKQIRDKDELIKRAIQQRVKGDKSKSFNSKQLLEEKLYDDGTIEESYAADSVIVLDENNKQIDASIVIALAASGYTYVDNSQSKSGGSGSVAFVHTLYYTMRYTPPYAQDMVYRVNRVETRIVQQTGSSYAVSIEHGYHIFNDMSDYSNSSVVYYPSTGTAYTVYSNHSNFYPNSGRFGNQIYSYYYITISGGSVIQNTNQI